MYILHELSEDSTNINTSMYIYILKTFFFNLKISRAGLPLCQNAFISRKLGLRNEQDICHGGQMLWGDYAAVLVPAPRRATWMPQASPAPSQSESEASAAVHMPSFSVVGKPAKCPHTSTDTHVCTHAQPWLVTELWNSLQGGQLLLCSSIFINFFV